MSIDKRISEFDIIEEFDITTKIPIIQGSPFKNGIITPKKFAESLGIIIEAGDVVIPMVTLTKAEYNSLSPKDPNIYYFIKEY